MAKTQEIAKVSTIKVDFGLSFMPSQGKRILHTEWSECSEIVILKTLRILGVPLRLNKNGYHSMSNSFFTAVNELG